jgi:hypothetical protein
MYRTVNFAIGARRTWKEGPDRSQSSRKREGDLQEEGVLRLWDVQSRDGGKKMQPRAREQEQNLEREREGGSGDEDYSVVEISK